MFVVQPTHPLLDSTPFITFSCFSMEGSDGRVDQTCQYLNKFVEHFQHKIFLLQHLLLPKQALLGNIGIIPYQIKCMEHNCHTNVPAPKKMMVTRNQQLQASSGCNILWL